MTMKNCGSTVCLLLYAQVVGQCLPFSRKNNPLFVDNLLQAYEYYYFSCMILYNTSCYGLGIPIVVCASKNEALKCKPSVLSLTRHIGNSNQEQIFFLYKSCSVMVGEHHAELKRLGKVHPPPPPEEKIPFLLD